MWINLRKEIRNRKKISLHFIAARNSFRNAFFPVFLFLPARRRGWSSATIVRSYLSPHSIHNIYDPLNYFYELPNFQEGVPSFLRAIVAPLVCQKLYLRASRDEISSFIPIFANVDVPSSLSLSLIPNSEDEVLFSPSFFLLEHPYGTEIRFQLPPCQPSPTDERRRDREREREREERRSDSLWIDILKRLNALTEWFVFKAWLWLRR